MQPVETAPPQQYLRMLLIALLETQQCLSPKLHEPALAFLRFRYQQNAYTLSEIKSWLEAVGDTSPLGPSPVSVQPAETSGHEVSPLVVRGGGPITSPFAIVALPRTAPPSPEASSSPSRYTLPDSALTSDGSVTFQLP